jgi:hypothetical protein
MLPKSSREKAHAASSPLRFEYSSTAFPLIITFCREALNCDFPSVVPVLCYTRKFSSAPRLHPRVPGFEQSELVWQARVEGTDYFVVMSPVIILTEGRRPKLIPIHGRLYFQLPTSSHIARRSASMLRAWCLREPSAKAGRVFSSRKPVGSCALFYSLRSRP